MGLDRVNRLLKQREGVRLEFKESRTDLPGNLFETICSMLNREGGDIYSDYVLIGQDGEPLVVIEARRPQ